MREKRQQEKAPADVTAWHTLSAEECARRLQVDPERGLDAGEVPRRLEEYGPNQLAEEGRESALHAFLRQYRPLMQLVLLGAAAVSIAIGEFSTAGVLFAVTTCNAFLGMIQESKAQRSVEALRQMLKAEARVRRSGEVVSITSEELVPGDIVLIHEGDRIPADGRLISAATLEVEESTLTGESTPVLKNLDPIDDPQVPLGDRTNLVFMNTIATRGQGEMVVTATGMSTQVGGIAGMLKETREEKTPLTRQIDQLIKIILAMAALTFFGVLAAGLSRGESFDALFTMGVALAVGAIPDGLPAVVTAILSVGTVSMAHKNAIIKRLPSVETLGSTSAICSDKTGTLTMNQMTVRTLVVAGARYNVTGQGYGTEGRIQRVAGTGDVALDPVLLPMVLCSDALVKEGECIGDPNEGALVVLAAKHGIDTEETRAHYPRLATLPFDSEYMFMATFHDIEDENGRRVVRCYVKGAPDKVTERATRFRRWDGTEPELDADWRRQIQEIQDELAHQGLRELVVARRDIDPHAFDPGSDLLALVDDLTLMALVGMVDPPRAEAQEAISRCKEAGIRVRMITGDHAVTAETVARELGIEGRAVTGAEFEAMSDSEVEERIDDIGVVARVAPKDKVRLVKVLQGKGDIVAMTGDGVNDAPALKAANIGVAMGITGTDVSKEAATMILTDDNFATIVNAVEEGRKIYDNLMKFIRLQMSNLVGFILGFLGAGAIASVALFNPIQVLWIHFGDLAPIGAALGFDTPTPGLMQRRPRPSRQPIIDLRAGVQIALSGLIMAAAAVGMREWAVYRYDSAAVAQTMALTVFAYLHISIALNLRYPDQGIFRRETLSNRNLWFSFLWAVIGMILVTEIGLMRDIFKTAELTVTQWAICLGASGVLLLLGEIIKPLLRLIPRKQG